MNDRWQRNVYRHIDPGLSSRLDMARALAAGLVVLEHVRLLYFAAYSNLDPLSKNPINMALFFVSRLGPEAVMVFFVLSGFLVGGSLLADVVNDRVRLRQYAINRLSRMYTVLIPALAAGALWDGLRLRWSQDPALAQNLGGSTLLLNVAFLQSIAGPCYGGNLPLWSLAFEFWYYFSWPCLLGPLLPGLTRPTRYAAGVGIVVLGVVGGVLAPSVLAFFPVWILGALLRVMPPVFGHKRWRYLLLPVVAIAAALSSRHRAIPEQYLLAFAFAALILHWMHGPKPEPSTRSFRAWATFAAFSFTLYAFHFPFIAFVTEALKKSFGWQIRRVHADPTGWFAFSLLFGLVYGYAWVCYWMAEHHTPRVRRWLGHLVDIAKPRLVDAP